jgi:hypothetical protein
MAVEPYFKDEPGYAKWLDGGGYVCNGLSMGATWTRMHRADSTSLNSSKGVLRTSVKKVCSRDLDELIHWVSRNHGPEGEGFQFCAFCRPQDDLK